MGTRQTQGRSDGKITSSRTDLVQRAAPLRIVLILDDYQAIEESVIHQGMAFFLEHLPAHLHLILSSRVDPDLPLARLRAHGQLTEIRADELRFQEGEASQFLDKMLSPPLSEEELQRLVSRTEGWIAGLHLVALTMQKREDRTAYLETLTGSQRYLLDYVQEDILARLSPDTRDFLLHSAILSRLDAAVCQAVTAAPTRSAPTPEPALPSAQQASAVFSAPGASLTRREQEVLRLLATGASNQEIAQTLVIELPTVKKHVSNLLGKLRASSRTQAISRARALSLL